MQPTALKKQIDPKIYVQVRHIYGRELIYPRCDTSKKLAGLIGTKTFTRSKLKEIEGLGYLLEWVPESLILD